MKNLIFTFTIILSFLSGSAQTAQILFINNNSGTSSLDLEIYDVSGDSVLSTYNDVDYLKATTKITVPSTRILNLTYYKAGTTEEYYKQTNVVYNSGEFRITFLYGTSSSKRYSVFTGSSAASSNTKIELDFVHSTPNLQEIDLRIRELGILFADNFAYTDKTFTFSNEFNAADYILDIMPFDNNYVGLFAYLLPGNTHKGEYLFLFTAGTGTANDVYMAQMNGVVTKLATATVADLDEIDLEQIKLRIFPNPANTTLNISGQFANTLNAGAMFTIYNIYGQEVLTSPETSIDISSLANGTYYISQGTLVSKFVVAR